MRDVVITSAEFFSYALLAVFAQNAVFTRALGVSRLVQLVGDDRTSNFWKLPGQRQIPSGRIHSHYRVI